ncbi:isoleucine--tRNA ligase [Atopobacter phocae]|uniref:isoleucine--tRNA ligase n=1 Tax=Atopobacter phocae TaxID=136492 RepID=UPI0004713DFE|nr:isoleucine--tRNA ligase [Atopobacter phocae]
MKLKETLQLGKTKFPMRGNLPVKEVERQQLWEEKDIYHERLKLNEGNESFMLHDGPPYANGAIHMGHALNKITKDFVVRSKLMQGYYAPYVPGWDTHGLPIEQALKNNKGIDRKKMSTAEFRELCAAYAQEQIDDQRRTFKRLGVQGDWEQPYVTLDHRYEAEQIRVFGKMAEKGYIYRGLKPIYWSPSSESSLAEAEIEYHDVDSSSIYVSFDVLEGKDIIPAGAQFIIWTTTPWTLPANLAIAVHPELSYVLVEVNHSQYVVAEDLLAGLVDKFNWENVQVVKTIKGSDLEHLTAKHPFYDRESLVILGEHVTTESGTGLVHTAPGHGADDYIVARRYHIEPLSPVDHEGKFTDEAPGFEGMFYADGNKKVLEILKENEHLIKEEIITHSYPHDWRTKQPVIFRATPQWFASIDAFREDILKTIEEEVEWLHPSGQRRIYNMVRDRGDWVISRQRVWGVPLPIFYGENGEAIMTAETIEHVAKLFEEHGSNIWFDWETEALLPEGFTHEFSPNGSFTREMDIMDVWFDSGTSYAGVLQTRPDLSFPADLYLEGSDQYRGWFNSSLTTSVAVNGKAPYKAVLSQGFVNDGEGRKMSKSLGNVISPDKEMSQRGADIIRLWVAQVDASADVRVSPDILNQISEGYRKIRNTMRFMLANTADYNVNTDRVSYEDLRSVDQYITVRLNQVIETVVDAYNRYDYGTVYKTIMLFLNNDMSSFYLDFAKDILYIETENDLKRRAMQTVMYDSLVALTKLLTPILVHTCEEVWTYLDEEEEFVQLANFPTAQHFESEEALLETWNQLMVLRQDISKALEEARNNKLIGKSFEAHVTVYPNEEARRIYKQVNVPIDQILIVSAFDMAEGQAPESAMPFEQQHVLVEHAEGNVCERCRATRKEVGTIEEAPHLCQRCYTIVKENFPEALVPETDEEE